MVNLIDTIVYAGRLKDKSALMSSSSGGAFTALSDAFLKSGDAVVAAVYNYENHTVEFQMILDEKQRERAKGSKYMQSKPGDIYQEAYHWLMDNPKKELLFVGMGCQSDGFRKFSEIKGIRDRVYIVDIICHGSPSPKLWREYAESIQKKDGRITYLTFKDKRNGWKSPTAYVKVNGSERPLKDYVKVFYNRCAFWSDFENKSFEYVAKKYGGIGLKNDAKLLLRKIKRKIKKLVVKGGKRDSRTI